MKTFKEFLTESERFDPAFIRDWAQYYNTVTVNSDNSISLDGGFNLGDYPNLIQEFNGQICLKVNFHKVVGDFTISMENLDTMIGCPEIITGHFVAWSNKFTSLEGIPREVGKEIDLSHNAYLRTFKGIHTLVNKCPKIVIPSVLESHVLGLLGIPNLKSIRRSTIDTKAPKQLNQMVMIVNRHLNGDKDILDCQEELITARLKEYARL